MIPVVFLWNLQILLANAAEHNTQNEASCAQGYKYILAEGEEPAHDGLRIALLHGRQSGVLLHDPEEHNTGGKCAQRAKVNGYHIHPLRGPRLDRQSYRHAYNVDHGGGRYAIEMQFLLKESDRGLKQVDNRGKTCKEDGHIEEDEHDPSNSTHIVKHGDQINEHQAGAAVAKVGTGGGHCGNNDEHGQ